MTLDLSGGGNIDGKSFASLGLLLTKADIPLLPDVRQVEEEIPGADGILDLETKFGARPINLTFELVEDYEVDYQLRLSEIAAVFNPVSGEKILVLERMPFKQWRVKYNGTINVEKIATLGVFTAPFKAYKPFAESVVGANETLDLGEGFTLGIGYELGGDLLTAVTVTTSPTTFTIKNLGNYESYPVITVSGTADNLTLTNTTTGEQFTFSDTLSGTLVINCVSKTVRKNDLNVFAFTDGEFPRLVSGDNVFTATATNPNLTVTFDYRHIYLY